MYEEDATTIAESLTRSFSNLMRASRAIAKVASMGADRIFYATRFAAWALVVEDGLSTDFGVALALTLATSAIIDNGWGRGFSMYRRELPESQAAIAAQRNRNPTKDADWVYPGMDTTFTQRAGYITIQGFCALYMFNSMPGSYLNSFAYAKLGARLTGGTFNAFCDASRDKSPPSSASSIVTAHLAGTFLGYSTISSFLSYNLPQIRNYYYQLFILNKIAEIDLATWWETITSTLLNTSGIAFAGFFSWLLLQDESFCHLGINKIPDRLILYWIIQACITNIMINGMMTLYAVHMRRINRHETDRVALAREIDMSPELDLIIRSAITVNSFAAFCATTVQIPNLPGIANKEWQYLAYNPALIILGLGLAARVSFLSQYALSSESDVFERLARKKEIEHKQDLELEERKLSEEHFARYDEDDEKEENRNIFSDMNNGYGSFSNGNGDVTNIPVPAVRESFLTRASRYVFFRTAEPQVELVDPENAAHFARLKQDVNNRFNIPEEPQSKSWECSIM